VSGGGGNKQKTYQRKKKKKKVSEKEEKIQSKRRRPVDYLRLNGITEKPFDGGGNHVLSAGNLGLLVDMEQNYNSNWCVGSILGKKSSGGKTRSHSEVRKKNTKKKRIQRGRQFNSK